MSRSCHNATFSIAASAFARMMRAIPHTRFGESVNQVHSLMRGSGGTLLANVASVVAGLRAAKHVVTERFKEGGHHNGG